MKTAITKLVKERIAESPYLSEFSKGLKLESVRAYEEAGVLSRTTDGTGNDGYMMRLLATFKCKPESDGFNNRVKFQINVYSDGTLGAYFEGSYYEA